MFKNESHRKQRPHIFYRAYQMGRTLDLSLVGAVSEFGSKILKPKEVVNQTFSPEGDEFDIRNSF